MDVKSLAVLMQPKKAMEGANLPAIPTPFDSTPEKPQKTGWVVKNCRSYRTTKSRYRTKQVNPPVMYERCQNERRTRYKPGKGDILYAETRVFYDGGPDTGCRK